MPRRKIINCAWRNSKNIILTSVADPDPYVFGPSGTGSGSVSQMYGSESTFIKQK
jgi:hypothetical protein